VEAGGVGLEPDRRHAPDVFLAALRLGLTSFGGPVAHLGYFRQEYVVRRRWLDDEMFSELVALANVLPGPSSSQLGIAIGSLRAGKLGGLLAWIGFTLPSAVLMVAFAYGVASADVQDAGWLNGLELAAAAAVAFALLAMARALTPDLRRLLLATGAAVVALTVGGAPIQVVLIALGAVAGFWLVPDPGRKPVLHVRVPIGRSVALGALVLFATLLVVLPLAAGRIGGHAVESFHAFYRAGALVFGGGHVVLPLLDASVVQPGWVGSDEFVAGYGAVQAVPGPLFTFSAYLGAIQDPEPNGVAGALLATVAIFLPSFLVLAGIGPIWSAVRAHPLARRGLAGIGAVVVGLLAAALWDPVLTGAVHSVWDALLVVVLFAGLRFLPPWVIVLGAAALGAVLL
jgi:chromate transporter